MQIRNIHEREIAASVETIGGLIDTLASDDDRLWPHDSWPAMRFDRPLGAGAVGGHGPIRYVIENFEPGRCIRFRFRAPPGFDGHHAFLIEDRGDRIALRHELLMRTHGSAMVTWPLIFRPLHDALIEDALDKAELAATTQLDGPSRWPLRVRILRHFLRRLGLARNK